MARVSSIRLTEEEARVLAEIERVKRVNDALKARGELEKAGIGKLRGLKEEIEQTKRAIDRAERDYDLNQVAELK